MKGFDLEKYESVLSRGLCKGLGNRNSQMCIEAAVCYALGLPHGDAPKCVSYAVRSFKIRLNDANWSSPAARATGLRDLGIAQLGSKGVVSDIEFASRITELTIREIIPELFREVFPDNADCLAAATRCEVEGTVAAAAYARATAADAADAAVYARATAYAAAGACARATAADAADTAAAIAATAADAADAAWVAAKAVKNDRYLIKSSQLGLRVLRELKSPGCELLNNAN
jgi:hypothetical protein